ncbi:MAG: fimbrial protein [Proteobacteria bacterium]|nr:fimbrial protein [Pseudomonadota bacterium]
MQKKAALLNAAAFAVVGLLSQGAFAADGTINFEGEIINSTCSVSPKSQNMTVPLGKIKSSVLKVAGDLSTPSKFTIDLLDCDAAKAKVTFSGPPDAINTDLLRLAGGLVGTTQATNVGVRIEDSSGVQIKLGQESQEYAVLPGANSLQFQARYQATGQSTVGIANATAQFTIAYQ